MPERGQHRSIIPDDMTLYTHTHKLAPILIHKGIIYLLPSILVAFSIIYFVDLFFYFSGYSNWILNYSELPPLIFLFFIIQYIVICGLLSKVKSHALASLACSSILFVAYIGLSIQYLGDYAWWIKHASTNILWMSELLSNLTYNFAYNNGLSMQYVAPIFGWLTCFIYLLIGKEIVCEKDSSYFAFLYRLSFLSTGISMLFYFNYIENTPLSIPFSLLYLYFAIRYLKYNNKLIDLAATSLALSIACLFHGQNTFLLPSLYILIIFDGMKNSGYKRIVRDITLSTIVIFAVTIISVFVVRTMGYQISPGNISGGGDSERFVALFSDGWTPYTKFLMFSFEHVSEISNIVIHSSPAVLILAILLVFKAVKRNSSYWSKEIVIDEMDPAIVVSGVLTLCYLSFIFLWNFDLGFPFDLDLMLSLGFPLSIFVFSMLYKLPENKKIYLTLGVFWGLYFNALFLSSFLTSRY